MMNVARPVAGALRVNTWKAYLRRKIAEGTPAQNARLVKSIERLIFTKDRRVEVEFQDYGFYNIPLYTLCQVFGTFIFRLVIASLNAYVTLNRYRRIAERGEVHAV